MSKRVELPSKWLHLWSCAVLETEKKWHHMQLSPHQILDLLEDYRRALEELAAKS